jgi:hypothetical protein
LGPNGENWLMEKFENFCLQKWIFAIFADFSAVFAVFRPLHRRICWQYFRLDWLTFLKCSNPLLSYKIGDSADSSRKLCQHKVSHAMVKLANFPVFSTKTQKNQLLQKKCRNSPWTNFHHLGKKIFVLFFKKSSDSFK